MFNLVIVNSFGVGSHYNIRNSCRIYALIRNILYRKLCVISTRCLPLGTYLRDINNSNYRCSQKSPKVKRLLKARMILYQIK